MKPINRNQNIIDGTAGGTRVEMGIERAAMSHIMSVLTDLYSDPELAVIREYSTNALDAHIEAKNGSPIEVTLPTEDNPYLSIRDYGDGLNADDITEIYSQYGASTKRGTDSLVGMLGLGCKSALTHTNTFDLISTKLGWTTHVTVQRDSDGGGSMTIVSERDAIDELDGTEVIIPAKPGNEFAKTATEFFKFWKSGTVLVDGIEPEHIDGYWINDHMVIVENESDRIVMGGVPYPVSGMVCPARPSWKFGLITFVEIGAVEFTPSREALQDTETTQRTVFKIRETAQKDFQTYIQRIMDKAETHQDAVKAMIAAAEFGYRGERLTFKGETIPTYVEHPVDQVNKSGGILIVDPVKNYRRKGWQISDTVSLTSLPNVVWIKGYDNRPFSASRREKMEKWIADNKIADKKLLFVDELPVKFTQWIEKSSIFDWAEIKAVKLPRKPSEKKLVGTYYVAGQGNGQGNVLADQIDTGQPLYYFDPKREAHGPAKRYFTLKHDSKATFVEIAPNREKKFVRDFPNAKRLMDAFRTEGEDWKNNLNAEEILYLKLTTKPQTFKMLRSLDATKVNDPEIKRAINAVNLKLTPKFRVGLDAFEKYVRELKEESVRVFENYPLVKHFYGEVKGAAADHIYIYINTIKEQK